MIPPPRRCALDLHRAPGGTLAGRGAMSFVGLAAQGLIRLAVSIVVGRLAGSATLGLVAAGLATAQLLILFGPTTSGAAASRFLARARGRADTAELDAVARHLAHRVHLATLVLAVIAVPFSLARGVSPTGAVCIGALVVGLSGQQFTRGVHYGVGAIRRVVTLDVAFSLAGLLGVVTALFLGVRGEMLLLPLALAYVLLSCACWPLTPRQAVPPTLAREIDRFVLFGSLGTIASAGLVHLSILVAGRLGPDATGYYAAASNLATPLTLASGALSLVLYPSLSESVGRGDLDAVAHHLDVAVRGLAALVTPVALGLVLLADPLIRVVYGTRFVTLPDGAAAPAPDILAVLVIAILTAMIAVPCVNALTSVDENGIVRMAFASLTGLAVAAAVWWSTAALHDVRTVAIGYLCGAGTIAAYAIVRAAQRWRGRWARPLSAAVVVVVAAGVVRVEVPDLTTRVLAAAALTLVAAAATVPEWRLIARAVAGAGRG